MDQPPSDAATQSAQSAAPDGITRPSPEERRAERVAKRKAAEAEMSLDEVRAARRARAAERQERLAALPDDLRAEKEAELAKAKQARLAGRSQA